jgi:DNA-binding response OmpR family regulator
MKKILIVEDEKELVKLLKIRFERAGYEVITAANGAEGLALCLEKKPDLLVVDVLMPQMTGYEMVRQIRAKGGLFSKIPVVVITAKASMKEFFEGFDHLQFIQKPFDQQKLLDMVGESIRAIDPGSSGAAWGGTADEKKISAISKKIMLLGVDEYLVGKLKDFLTNAGHRVYSAQDEKDAISQVSRLRPDACLVQYFEDPLTLDAVKVYNHVSSAPETKDLPFATFCLRGLDLDAYKTMKTAHIIPYSESSDLLKSVERFVQDKL